MELAFLVAHRAHRRFASKPSTKVQADVRGTQAVAVHRQLATLTLADAQAPNLGQPLLVHLLPRPARTKTFAARLRRAVFGRQRHHKAFAEFAHQPDANRGWVAALDATRTVGGAPRIVCQHESSRVLLLVDGSPALIQSLYGLLRRQSQKEQATPLV